MTTNSENLSRNIYCLRSELLAPVISMYGAYKLLLNKVPEIATTKDIIFQIGKICDELHGEIFYLPENINLKSPTNAAEQMHSIASKWEQDSKILSGLVTQIYTVDFHLEDTDLDKTLKKNCFQQFVKVSKLY